MQVAEPKNQLSSSFMPPRENSSMYTALNFKNFQRSHDRKKYTETNGHQEDRTNALGRIHNLIGATSCHARERPRKQVPEQQVTTDGSKWSRFWGAVQVIQKALHITIVKLLVMFWKRIFGQEGVSLHSWCGTGKVCTPAACIQCLRKGKQFVRERRVPTLQVVLEGHLESAPGIACWTMLGVDAAECKCFKHGSCDRTQVTHYRYWSLSVQINHSEELLDHSKKMLARSNFKSFFRVIWTKHSKELSCPNHQGSRWSFWR